MSTIVDYRFSGSPATNPDGTLPMTLTNVTVVPGPGATPLGDLAAAIDLGASGKGSISLGGAAETPSRTAFCLRVVFQANAPITDRQNLVESTGVPFAMFLTASPTAGDIILSATVGTNAHGWGGCTTRFSPALRPGVWYTADLAFDNDTVGLFINDQLVSVHAFPQGTLMSLAGNRLYLGTWVDGVRNHFNGKIAALQWNNEVPAAILSRLDEARTTAEWFCSYKWELVRPRIALGEPTARPAYNVATGAYIQPCQAGLLMYHDSVGAAFEMHGAIYALYNSNAAVRSSLGYLVSDESNTTRGGGRKSVFTKGAIYWSGGTGAVPVTGRIYLAYENLGESLALGFPVLPASGVPGGLQQEFQFSRMYYRTNATRAFEVHGAILAKFLATGGVGMWGFPVTNESDVKRGSTIIGKSSEFEGATIFWSSSTGAFEVHGDIRRKYAELGGPASDLGFPTSDEGSIPGAGGARFNTFQNASILWFGTFDGIIVARPFKVFIGRINTQESEGAFMGQNDLYFRVTLTVGGTVVYNQRHPSSGDFGGNNSRNLNLTIPNVVVPNAPGKTVRLTIDVWESDDGAPFGGGDDHLGFYSHDLTMADGWGMRTNTGIFESGHFSMVNNISWSVKPQVDFARLTETEKFWGVTNQGTATISYAQYASAFRDVDSDSEWWDLTDWLEKAFYELVVKGIAGNGNCFGMSLEAIYARKFMSLFGLPINRFTTWSTVKNEFNIKHCYQVGAEAIWWFVGEFITGNTHDPKDVFTETRNAFSRGDHPVLCVAQNADFSGAPHCILPVAWDSSTNPWRMTICDPNFPNALKTLTVDPNANRFEYVGASTYRGGEWTGGRLHYMPFCLLNSRPRTPIWDAILLLLAGTIIILGEGTETIGLTDPSGRDIDASGDRAIADLKAGRHLDGYFVPFKGYDARRPTLADARTPAVRRVTPASRVPGIRVPVIPPRTKGTIPGEVLMRRGGDNPNFQGTGPRFDPRAVASLSMRELISATGIRGITAPLRTHPVVQSRLLDRAPQYALNDPAISAELTASVRKELAALLAPLASSSFNHSVRTAAGAALRYGVKHGLGEIRVEGAAVTAVRQRVQSTGKFEVADLGTSRTTVNITSSRDQTVTLEFTSKLGVGKDTVSTQITGVPLQAAQRLMLNPRPGLSGLDLIPTIQTGTAGVTIKATVDNRPITRRFRVPLEGGIRIKPAQALADGTLTVSRINSVFGPAGSATVFRSA